MWTFQSFYPKLRREVQLKLYFPFLFCDRQVTRQDFEYWEKMKDKVRRDWKRWLYLDLWFIIYMWVTEPILNKDFNNNSNYKSFDRLKDKVVGTVSVSEVMFNLFRKEILYCQI